MIAQPVIQAAYNAGWKGFEVNRNVSPYYAGRLSEAFMQGWADARDEDYEARR